MADPFASKASTLESPARHAAVVTPDDDNDLPTHCRALLVGVAGNLKVTTVGGETLVIPSVPVGVLDLGCVRVFDADTTAEDITALW